MPNTERTSLSHPIEVGFLAGTGYGRVGLTLAPGKKQSQAATGSWDRDLAADLARIRDEFGADHLVCLLEDAELAELSITGLSEAADKAGLKFHRFPIADGTTPQGAATFGALISEIAGWAAAGECVVIHCKGGLGRAGTVGGCVLRALGQDSATALESLAAARGPSCPETSAQRAFIASFVPFGPSRQSRFLGCVLGAAIGDALGHETEFMSMAAIRQRFGPAGVTGFERWWTRDRVRFAPYTDDTQMAEIVLRALLALPADASLDEVMTPMGAAVAHWKDYPQGGHRAPGNACLAGAEQLKRGVAWRDAGGPAAGGCGSVMRAYPFGLVFNDDLAKAEHWAVEHSRMTHGDPIALAACAAMGVGVALEVRGSSPALVLAAMVEAAARHDAGTARMAQAALDDAARGVEPEAVFDRLRGWAAHEAIAAAMYVVARHERDLPGALLEGANSEGDSDSIATLAGALLGARLGLEAVRADWVRDVERSDELLALGRAAAERSLA